MNSILQASHSTLQQSKSLLSKLSNSQLCDKSVSPYYSSIGSHIRHILDFYKCIFQGIDNGVVDLTKRERNNLVEEQCENANSYLIDILQRINNLEFESTDLIDVVDDLGMGKVTMKYTIASLFSQANSHTIHHYAIINYILDRLDVSLEDNSFGFNPTSPKPVFNKH